jgi:hypothetical protein
MNCLSFFRSLCFGSKQLPDGYEAAAAPLGTSSAGDLAKGLHGEQNVDQRFRLAQGSSELLFCAVLSAAQVQQKPRETQVRVTSDLVLARQGLPVHGSQSRPMSTSGFAPPGDGRVVAAVQWGVLVASLRSTHVVSHSPDVSVVIHC